MTMKVANPLLRLLDWLDLQAPEVREDLCLWLLFLDDAGIPEVEDVASYTRRFHGTPRSIRDAGRALQMRAAFEIRLRRMASSWDRGPGVVEAMASRFDAEMKERFEQSLREAPLREKRWRKAYADWQVFRDESLTDQDIERFIDRYLSTGVIED